MLFTIVNINDVFYKDEKITRQSRSSNPYDYIRAGYYVDNAALFGGSNNVNFNCNFSSNTSSNRLDFSDK